MRLGIRGEFDFGYAHGGAEVYAEAPGSRIEGYGVCGLDVEFQHGQSLVIFVDAPVSGRGGLGGLLEPSVFIGSDQLVDLVVRRGRTASPSDQDSPLSIGARRKNLLVTALGGAFAKHKLLRVANPRTPLRLQADSLRGARGFA